MITDINFNTNIDYKKLDELLTHDTYQGMSDEEIELIIAWKMSAAYARGNSDAIQSQGMINAQAAKKRSLDNAQRIEDMIQSIQMKAHAIVEGR